MTPWKPGVSGNPGGRPKIPADVKELARALTPAAIRRLALEAGITFDGKVTKTKAPPNVRVRAVEIILDRAWGKAEQAVHVTGDARNPERDLLARLLADLAAANGAHVSAGPEVPALPDVTATRARTETVHESASPAPVPALPTAVPPVVRKRQLGLFGGGEGK